jgi:hypothetical protein
MLIAPIAPSREVGDLCRNDASLLVVQVSAMKIETYDEADDAFCRV